MDNKFTFEELITELRDIYNDIEVFSEFEYAYIHFNHRKEYIRVSKDTVKLYKDPLCNTTRNPRSAPLKGYTLDEAVESINAATRSLMSYVERSAEELDCLSEGEQRSVAQKVKEFKESINEAHLLAWAL